MKGRFDVLFRSVWRRGDTPESLADKLSVERYGHPNRLVIRFRRLRQDARQSAARTYLKLHG
jgi:hypothetical protein